MNRRIGLIALAIVLALVGTFAVYTYAHNADKRAVAKTRSVQVVYAQKNVPVGTTWGQAVSGGFLGTERLPVDSVPATALSDTNASIPLDETATFAIGSGQVVTREMFSVRSSTTGALAIPKGLLAVSVTLNASADVASFVQAGSEVAIFNSFKVVFPSGAPSQSGLDAGNNYDVTKMLLPRVSVLAVTQHQATDLNGSTIAPTGNSGNNSGSGSVLVTLALSQADAEKMIEAQYNGQLYLGLLSDSSVTGPDAGTGNTVNLSPVPINVD